MFHATGSETGPTLERLRPYTLLSSPPCAQALRAACILVAFLTPLKLSLTYIVLVPLILCWLISSSWRYGLLSGPAQEKAIIAPLAFLLLATTLSAILGIDLGHSLSPLSSLLFFSLTVLVFRDFGNSYYTPLALVTGQAIAALHSVLAAAFPSRIPSIFLGSVTESGQLALSILVCLGMAWQKFHDGRQAMSPLTPRIAAISGGVAIAILGAFGFKDVTGLSTLTLATLWIGGAALIVILLCATRPHTAHARGFLTLSTIYLPLLACALLVNLKRGPWLGVAIGTAVFCLFFARRFLAVIVTGALVVAVSVPPIRERLAASYEHFTISGGRSTIWRIGAELISQYPLGVGYHNSGILRAFSLEIPPELKHFHNNLINIAAESGLFTTAIFIWFIYGTIRVSFSRPLVAMHVAIGCALLSWQTAGLVEYNFGDSEVMIIVWMLLGLLLGDVRKGNLATSSST